MTEAWVAKIDRTEGDSSIKHEIEGDPQFIWEQCGFLLSDDKVHRVTLERIG